MYVFQLWRARGIRGSWWSVDGGGFACETRNSTYVRYEYTLCLIRSDYSGHFWDVPFCYSSIIILFMPACMCPISNLAPPSIGVVSITNREKKSAPLILCGNKTGGGIMYGLFGNRSWYRHVWQLIRSLLSSALFASRNRESYW